jgi:hypothetical protein
MSKEATQNVPRGLVRSLTTRWELNGDDIGDMDSAQRSVRTSRGTGTRPRKNIPQLHKSFFQEILGGIYGELEVTGFTVEQERGRDPNQTSDILSVQVLSADQPHVHIIFKSINSSSPKAKVRRQCCLPLTIGQMKCVQIKSTFPKININWFYPRGSYTCLCRTRLGR